MESNITSGPQVLLAYVASGRYPAHPLHVYVHEDEVGLEQGDLVEGFLAGFRLADDLEALVDLTTRRAAVRKGAWSSTTSTLTASPGIRAMLPER